MFYVGDTLWLEKEKGFYDIPNWHTFSGCIRNFDGTKYWIDKGYIQSFLLQTGPVTKEWLPAIIYSDGGTKAWYDKGQKQSFQDLRTGEWMPAVVGPDGLKVWYDEGRIIDNPETYSWNKNREE